MSMHLCTGIALIIILSVTLDIARAAAFVSPIPLNRPCIASSVGLSSSHQLNKRNNNDYDVSTSLFQEAGYNRHRFAKVTRHNGHYGRGKVSSLQAASTATAVLTTSSAASVLTTIVGALSGGFFAGGLHAVAGPDHLAAILPRCCGQRWYKAGRVGILWGFGHGISATLLGVMAFAVKSIMTSTAAAAAAATTTSTTASSSLWSRVIASLLHNQWLLSGASKLTEIAVGLSLIAIGVLGMKEAREWQNDWSSSSSSGKEEQPPVVVPKSLSAAAVDPMTATTVGVRTNRSVLWNGLVHGLSWDGAPSLAPALAVATWSGNLAFLTAYALGTTTTMAIATTLVGEGTRRAGQVFQRPDLPQKLSVLSSGFAVAIGTIWCALALR